ncbi:MAG TPA: YqgE/AlgH family protein [Tepidisphaeraceae bacterium]|nr:YqgE/AlgH family protein [Tepidisphaeraceae bacterium]
MSQPQKGHLLVASPTLRDPNFYRTVVLLVQHDENGTLGLVLNRPLQISIQAAWKELSQAPCQLEGPLHHGGPCNEGVLMALHSDEESSDLQIAEGLHFATSRDCIERIVACPPDNVRLFVGHAGWSPGQLEAEITEGAWLTTSATAERVFSAGQGTWEQLLRAIGKAALTQWINPKLVPDDPSVN